MSLTAVSAAAPPGEAAQLSERDFERVRAMIYDLAGIVIEAQKRQMVHARLSRRLREHEAECFSTYLDAVEKGHDKAEVQNFINAITTNLTSFFREKHHFEHFQRTVLPGPRASDTRLRVWSAGCSTGEEPYSIALTALTANQALPDDFKILATDLDTGVLEKAKAALYAEDKAGDALRSFGRLVESAPEGALQIGAAARGLISFRQLNLMGTWPMSGLFDAIFCRNVLIYFNAETKAALVNRFAAQLHPGGFLYLGHSESILGEHPLLVNEGQTTYRRRQA